MKTSTFKGYAFALIATLAFSNVYIFSKAALNVVHLTQFGLYWFAIGTILNFLFALKNRKLGQLKTLSAKQVRILVTLGILEILTTTTFFVAIDIIPDPSVTSFLGNLFPVMVMMGGILILKEKFGWIETVGAAVALIGAFIISYNGGASLKTLFIRGAGVVVINALLATTATLVVKVHVKKLSPELLNLNRSTWLLAYSVMMFFIFRQSAIIPLSAFENIAIGAILGPFLSVLTVYYSYRYIDASRSAIVQSLKGIFVLFGALLFFKTFPLPHQLFGGILSVTGVLALTMAQANVIREKKHTVKN